MSTANLKYRFYLSYRTPITQAQPGRLPHRMILGADPSWEGSSIHPTAETSDGNTKWHQPLLDKAAWL